MAEEENNKNTFQFELVSPEHVVVSEKATMAIIPGTDGEFGVLVNHSPVLSSIITGIVTLHTATEGIKKFFVSGGFVDVSSDLCSLLAEEAVNINELEKPEIQQEIDSFKTGLSRSKSDSEKARFQNKIKIAEIKMSFAD